MQGTIITPQLPARQIDKRSIHKVQFVLQRLAINPNVMLNNHIGSPLIMLIKVAYSGNQATRLMDFRISDRVRRQVPIFDVRYTYIDLQSLQKDLDEPS